MKQKKLSCLPKALIDKIARADCFDFLAKIPARAVDLAIIDPPYNMGKGDWDRFAGREDFLDFTRRWIDAFLPAMKPGSSVYVFNSPENCAFILPEFIKRGAALLNWITWHKRDGFSASRRRYLAHQETILFFSLRGGRHFFNPDAVREPYFSTERMRHAAKKGILKNGRRWYPNPRGRLCGDVWEFSSHRHKEKVNGRLVKQPHPTPKPEDMIERMILASSNPGDVVLDFFSGTGTTAVVCRKTNRRFLGCEKDRKFYAVGNERIKNVDR